MDVKTEAMLRVAAALEDYRIVCKGSPYCAACAKNGCATRMYLQSSSPIPAVGVYSD